jgi:platelet-activating factor acetylhydrolase
VLEGQHFLPIPFTRAVALDPWLEPLPTPGPAPFHVESAVKGRPSDPPKLLVINSEGFTLWHGHFARLKKVVQAWDASAKETTRAQDGDKKEDEPYARLITLVRAKHVSFSDFGVIVPFGSMAKDGRRFLDIICDLANAFLGEGFAEVLGRQHQVDGQVEFVEGKKGQKEERLVGSVGDIVVH